MKRLYTAHFIDPKLALLKTVLETEDIPFFVRNEQLSIAIGGVPISECYPELWIMNDTDYSRAKQICDKL